MHASLRKASGQRDGHRLARFGNFGFSQHWQVHHTVENEKWKWSGVLCQQNSEEVQAEGSPVQQKLYLRFEWQQKWDSDFWLSFDLRSFYNNWEWSDIEHKRRLKQLPFSKYRLQETLSAPMEYQRQRVGYQIQRSRLRKICFEVWIRRSQLCVGGERRREDIHLEQAARKSLEDYLRTHWLHQRRRLAPYWQSSVR